MWRRSRQGINIYLYALVQGPAALESLGTWAEFVVYPGQPFAFAAANQSLGGYLNFGEAPECVAVPSHAQTLQNAGGRARPLIRRAPHSRLSNLAEARTTLGRSASASASSRPRTPSAPWR